MRRSWAVLLASTIATPGCATSQEGPGEQRVVAARPASTAPIGGRARAAAPRDPLGARLLRPAQLRERPGGRVVARLGTRTPFGSPRVLAVVARRGAWLGVLSEERPNGRTGWVPADAAELVAEPYAIEVDRSSRRLVVRRRGRAVRSLRVAVGAPGAATPTGRFAVTDLLRTGRPDSPYGCCILALSGRQPDLPQGWSGGDRLAIHGTSDETSVGRAASMGCLRARAADVRWLLAHVTLGTPVRIRA
jgi:lipoprotein-anchoring transpeptidase ErfK/SrfK